jgi:hypothetical protein
MAKTVLPYVPPEGQPPAWWQDLRVQAMIIAAVTSLVRKLGVKIDPNTFDSNLAATVGWAFQIVIPVIMTGIGQMKSIWRRQIVSGTIQAAVDQPANVPPDMTAATARANAPDNPCPSPATDVSKAYGTDRL